MKRKGVTKEAMTITTYQVQNILRTYGKMLGRKKNVDQASDSASSATPLDKIDISSGAKRRQVINEIAQEIIGQVTSNPQKQNQVEKEALTELSQEYGQSLEVFQNRDGSLRFVVLDSEAKDIVQELTQEENQKLEERFSELAKSIVDRNMVS